VQIGFGGSLSRKVCSRSRPTSTPWLALKVDVFLGRVCGGLRLLRGRLFFSWSAAQGKILTVENLRKKNIIIVDRCYLCKRDGESVDHLLLHCDVASTLWIHVFTRFGMSWVMLKRVIDLFACWWKSGRPKSAAVWKMVPICIFWCVWKERNLSCFEDQKNSMEDILASFFHTLYLWTMAF
jgi:hypothetical protein